MTGALRRLGAIVSGLLLVGAAGAVVAADALEPPPAPAVAEAPIEHLPATTVTLACAGPPELTTGPGMSVDPDLDPVGTETVTHARVASLPRGGADPGATSLGDLAAEEVRELPASAVPGHDLAPAGPVVLTAEPTGEQAALAGGATLARTDAGDGRGLVATACLPATSAAWLVGGSTAVGASAVLTLTNVGPTAATVDVSAWGSTGPVDAPGGIVVAPHSRERVLLEGALGVDPRLAVRVSASGGSVAAAVQSHAMDGIVPAGIDTVAPAAAPARQLTVPAVRLTGTDTDGESAVRVVNPGAQAATLAVTLLGPDGEVEVPGADAVVVDPGAVFEVSLAGLPAGTYAVALESDQPVTAAVRTERVGAAGEIDPDTAPVDHAWSPATAALTAGLLAVPADVADAATLVLTNPAEEEVTARLVAPDGPAEEVVVPARATVTAPLEGTVRLAADGDGVVAAAVLSADAPDGELLSVLPATADLHEARSVRVDLR